MNSRTGACSTEESASKTGAFMVVLGAEGLGGFQPLGLSPGC